MDTDRNMRRIDSCGSLDSHTHRYNKMDTAMQVDPRIPHCRHELRASREDMLQIDDGEYEQMGSPDRSRRSFFPGKSPRKTSPQFPFQPSEPISISPAMAHTFRPIPAAEQRPKTTGLFPHHDQPQRYTPQLQPRSPSPRKIVRPASATPDERRRINCRPPRKYSIGCIDPRNHSTRPPMHPNNTRSESLV